MFKLSVKSVNILDKVNYLDKMSTQVSYQSDFPLYAF